jgi:hypothetical protein
MSEPHELRCYEYVNRPYAQVRDALRADPAGIFERATKGAASRAHDLAASLHVDLGGVEIGAEVAITVEAIDEVAESPMGHAPMTKLKLSWKAAKAAGLFPSMAAELSIYGLSKDETQLDLHGRYTPPLGALGSALDSLVGHRLADASVHRFLADVASLLKAELPAP